MAQPPPHPQGGGDKPRNDDDARSSVSSLASAVRRSELTPGPHRFAINSPRLVAAASVRAFPMRHDPHATHDQTPPSSNPRLDLFLAEEHDRFRGTRPTGTPSHASSTLSHGTTATSASRRITARQRASVALRLLADTHSRYLPSLPISGGVSKRLELSKYAPSHTSSLLDTRTSSYSPPRSVGSSRYGASVELSSQAGRRLLSRPPWRPVNNDEITMDELDTSPTASRARQRNESLSKDRSRHSTPLINSIPEILEQTHDEKYDNDDKDRNGIYSQSLVDRILSRNTIKDTDDDVIVISDNDSDSDAENTRRDNLVSLSDDDDDDSNSNTEGDNALELAFRHRPSQPLGRRIKGMRGRYDDRALKSKSSLLKKRKYRRPRASIHTKLFNMLKERDAIEAEHRKLQLEIIEKRIKENRLLDEQLREFDERSADDLIKSRLEAEKPKDKSDVETGLVPLTADQNKVVDTTFDIDDSTIICEAFNIPIKAKDIDTLSPGAWLNDEIINFYGSLIMDRAEKHPNDYPKIHCFNTFFYSKLQGGYMSVRSWSRRFDVFSKDKIIIPTHLGNHWICSCINLRDKRIEIYDSLGGKHAKIAKTLLDYVVQDWNDKKVKKGLATEQFDTSDWTVDYKYPGKVPQQLNGYDCGVFTCSFMEAIARDVPKFKFNQSHMDHIRRRIVFEIVSRTLL